MGELYMIVMVGDTTVGGHEKILKHISCALTSGDSLKVRLLTAKRLELPNFERSMVISDIAMKYLFLNLLEHLTSLNKELCQITESSSVDDAQQQINEQHT